MASALQRAGADVTLFARYGDDDRSLDGYAIDDGVRVQQFDWPAVPVVGGLLYGRHVASAVRGSKPFDLVYGRDLYSSWWLRSSGIPFAYEVHAVGRRGLRRRAELQVVTSGTCRAVVAITDVLRRDYEREWEGHGHAPIVVLADGADAPKNPALALDLRPPRAGFRVGYAGSLHPGKGIETLLAVAARMQDVDFEVVGGTDAQIRTWTARGATPNVTFHGWKPHDRIETFLREMDVLYAPYGSRVAVDGGTGDVARWMSPLKLFEYMAAGVPVVASDLEVIREVMTDEVNGLLRPAGDVAAWVDATQRLRDDAALCRALARRALDDLLAEYTWDVRATRILSLLTQGTR